MERFADFWERAMAGGRRVYDLPDGVGVEFADGCDAFFIRRGEPLADAGDKAIWAEYARLDAARTRIVRAVRRLIAQARYGVAWSPTGQWTIGSGGMTSWVDVGLPLTLLLRRMGELDAFRKVLFNTILTRPEGDDALRELLDRDAPVAGERPLRDGDEAGEFGPEAAVGWMKAGILLCDDAELTPERIAAMKENPPATVAAIEAFAKRVDAPSAHVELTTSAFETPFDDGEDAYKIHRRSRKLVAMVDRLGPQAAGEQLAKEYALVNRGRSRVLRALRRLMHEAGYSLHRDFASGSRVWHFGRTRREITIETGDALTHALTKRDDRETLARLLAEHGALKKKAAAEFDRLAADPEAPIDERRLPATETAPPTLPELRDLDLPLLDELARRHVEEMVRTDPRILDKWEEPGWYRHGGDAWIDEARWLAIAREKWVASDGYDDRAAYILLTHGDETPKSRLIERLGAMDAPEHEAMWEAVTWLLRNEHPIAAEWFEEEVSSRLLILLASQGDAAACRYFAVQVRESLISAAGQEDPAEARRERCCAMENLRRLPGAMARRFLGDAELDSLHAKALAWARQDRDDSLFTDCDALYAAAAMGWGDVGEALVANPAFQTWLFSDDEMAVLSRDDLTLAVSLASPGEAVARIVATLMLSEAVQVQFAKIGEVLGGVLTGMRQRLHASGSDSAIEAATGWKHYGRQSDAAHAVAWLRCRAAVLPVAG